MKIQQSNLVHLPGGVPPQKGLIMNIRDLFPKLSVKCRVQKRRFLAFPWGPGGFSELRGASRNHFHLSWYLIVPEITNYGQKPWGDCLPSTVQPLLGKKLLNRELDPML